MWTTTSTADVDHYQHGALVHQRRDLLFGMQGGHAVEGGRAVEMGYQVARSHAAVLVVERVGNVLEIEGGGVAEYQQLDHGRHDEHEAAPAILEQGQELLADERQQLGQHVVFPVTRAVSWICAR